MSHKNIFFKSRDQVPGQNVLQHALFWKRSIKKSKQGCDKMASEVHNNDIIEINQAAQINNRNLWSVTMVVCSALTAIPQ
jgi:hypothetical protein